MTYDSWCVGNKVTHGHCPDNCPHPQPFVRDGKLWCGRCWFKFGEMVEMVPCGPEICEEIET